MPSNGTHSSNIWKRLVKSRNEQENHHHRTARPRRTDRLSTVNKDSNSHRIFTLTFEPFETIPDTFDFIEGDVQGAFVIRNISFEK